MSWVFRYSKGWLNLSAAEYSAAVNHCTYLALQKLDVLDTFAVVRMAVAYTTPAGDWLNNFPVSSINLDKFEVDYINLLRWQCLTK